VAKRDSHLNRATGHGQYHSVVRGQTSGAHLGHVGKATAFENCCGQKHASAAGMEDGGGQAQRMAPHDPSPLAFLLQNPDVLGCVLRTGPAAQASICALHAVQSVCKSWLAAGRLVFSDAQWLAPFVEAAEAFLCQIPLLLSNVIVDHYEESHEPWTTENATALVLDMRTYRSHARVQEACCEGLALELEGDTDNMLVIVGVGSIHAVVDATLAHVGDAGVQEHGCMVLSILADYHDNVAAITGAGGIHLVLTAMMVHAARGC